MADDLGLRSARLGLLAHFPTPSRRGARRWHGVAYRFKRRTRVSAPELEAAELQAAELEAADLAFAVDIGRRGVDGWVAAFDPRAG